MYWGWGSGGYIKVGGCTTLSTRSYPGKPTKNLRGIIPLCFYRTVAHRFLTSIMFSRRLVIKIGRTPTLLLLLTVLTCPCPTTAFPAQSLNDDARNANSFSSPYASAFLPIAPAEVNGNNTLARRQGCPNLTLLCPSGGCCSYDSSCCGNMCCPSGYLCTGGTADAPCCVPITSSDNICVNVRGFFFFFFFLLS